jgi:hypothetical protein
MSYALGAAPQLPAREQIHVGRLAATDPIMSAASLMASNLLLQSVAMPRAKRLTWLRVELNKSQPGLGTTATGKVNGLLRRGTPPNQALFDGLRLALAEFFAKRFEQIQRKARRGGRGLSGLGESVGDIRATGCLIMGTIGAGGATATALMENPAGSTAVGTAAAGVMTANSCNADALRAQADVINAQARLAAAGAGGVSIAADSNTLLYVGLGIGAAVLLVGGLFVLKK